MRLNKVHSHFVAVFKVREPEIAVCFAFQVLDALLCGLVHIFQLLVHLLRLLLDFLLLLLAINRLVGR